MAQETAPLPVPVTTQPRVFGRRQVLEIGLGLGAAAALAACGATADTIPGLEGGSASARPRLDPNKTLPPQPKPSASPTPDGKPSKFYVGFDISKWDYYEQKGIDKSETIDCAQMVKDGFGYLILRAGRGYACKPGPNYTCTDNSAGKSIEIDTIFEAMREEIREAGRIVPGYYYFIDPGHGAEQARNFNDLLNDTDPYHSKDRQKMPGIIILDPEKSPTGFNYNGTPRTREEAPDPKTVKEFYTELRKLMPERVFVMYGNSGELSSYLPKGGLPNTVLWWARWLSADKKSNDGPALKLARGVPASGSLRDPYLRNRVPGYKNYFMRQLTDRARYDGTYDFGISFESWERILQVANMAPDSMPYPNQLAKA